VVQDFEINGKNCIRVGRSFQTVGVAKARERWPEQVCIRGTRGGFSYRNTASHSLYGVLGE